MKYYITYMAALLVANEVGRQRMDIWIGLLVIAVLLMQSARMIKSEGGKTE